MRNIRTADNNTLPHWDSIKCIQCNLCSLVCPSGAIRPFVLNKTEAQKIDNVRQLKDNIEKKYTIAISARDCIGCGSCVEICPSFKKALSVKPAEPEYAAAQQEKFDFLSSQGNHKECTCQTFNVKDSQFLLPQADFNSVYTDEAASPYIKLIRQLFGKNFVVANGLDASAGEWIFRDIKWAYSTELESVVAAGNNLNIMLFGTEKDINPEELIEKINAMGRGYVACIAMGADPAQTLRAIYSAVNHKGPSVILAYAVSVENGIEAGKLIETARTAVHTGKWKLSSVGIETIASLNVVACEGAEENEEHTWQAINMAMEKNPMPEQRPDVRITNFDEGKLGYTADMAVREAMRCLKCRKKPCMLKGCPVSNQIPDFIQKVAESDFEAAYKILSETSCLPAVCGRVCQQDKQCEGNCVRGIKGEPVAIGNLERFVADWYRKNINEPNCAVKDSNGRGVAIVGSGPAGIACADSLADMGYSVAVYEKEIVAGGVLTYGIPEFRLPAEVTNYEIKKLADKGVQIMTGVSVGTDITIEELINEKGYDAVFLACGADIPLNLNIPGEALDGVWLAKDYLFKVNMNNSLDAAEAGQLPHAKKIAVIGGGNVAMDACRCAARSGAEKVYVIYRRSEHEMPADPIEVCEAKEEGVEFVYLTNPITILGENGSVVGLECLKMELGEADDSGRRRAEVLVGSNFVLDVDCVIMAIGSRVDSAVLETVDALGISTDRGILTDKLGCTGVAGLFAGGDVVTGPASVVKAMGAGRVAAQSIDKYIRSNI